MDIVQNPKQLYVILGKVKNCQFFTTLDKIGNFAVAPQAKIKFKGFYASAGGASENFSIFCRRAVFLMHLEERAAQIVDLFARLDGGCWPSNLSTPSLRV